MTPIQVRWRGCSLGVHASGSKPGPNLRMPTHRNLTNPSCRHEAPAVQGGNSVQRGLSAAFGSVALGRHRGAADKRLSLALMLYRPLLALGMFLSSAAASAVGWDQVEYLALTSPKRVVQLWFSFTARQKSRGQMVYAIDPS